MTARRPVSAAALEQTDVVRPVVMVTLTGVIALVVALLTGSTVIALGVIGLAVAGIVLLARDWRTLPSAVLETAPHHEDPGPDETALENLKPDEFSPDISGDPDGPSSDARAD